MRFEIVSIDKLLPLEKVFPNHLKNLEELIDNDGFVLKAIIVDKKTGTILDGSHRYVYFLKKGYKEVPVYYTDYDDEDVRVGTRLQHRFFVDGDTGISKKECRERALSGNLFPPRTTRHFFTFRKSDISVPLAQLVKGAPVDVSHLIAEVDVNEEIIHNRGFVKEINEEIETIVKYLEEVSQTKSYLLKQIELMDAKRKIGFFPGKFHPPHVGHIKTILDLLPNYRKIIIGVSEHLPEEGVISTPTEIMNTIAALFAHMDNIEVCLIKGTLVKKTDTSGLPDFDVLLSGNQEVLDWAVSMGIEGVFVQRSYGLLCSGTEIRGVLNDK